MRKTLIISLTFALVVAIFAGVTGIAVAMGTPRPAAGVGNEVWYGFYTDATSYAPGDTINIYASAPYVNKVFRLVQLNAGWKQITSTGVISVTPQTAKVGSFIEFPGLTLAGRTGFTLEGWYLPTLVGGDYSVIAGQYGANQAAAALLVRPDGRIAAYVSPTATTSLDAARYAIAPAPPNFDDWLDTWHHLAMTYNNSKVKLYIDGTLVVSRTQTGAVASVLTSTVPFRLGARAEAPGNLTGIIDGRLDSWALWRVALPQSVIESRRQRGLAEGDPIPNNLNLVDLYVGFEDAYPAVTDASPNHFAGVVVNHGNPGMAGVLTNTGKSFRLNHDEIVDAGWSLTAQLPIPPGTESGMYAVQELVAPDYQPSPDDVPLSVRAIAIRPAPAAPRAPIAVVLPTNTWNAYNHWPLGYGPGNVISRTRHPLTTTYIAGGNNSAYSKLGDGVSLSYYHGWHRPSVEASPITPTTKGGYSVRAPNSMYMVQWLDAQGFDYDVYSDDDFDAGLITATDYKVLMPHSHHEYWSDGMFTTMSQFLDAGGSVIAPAGNMAQWRVVYGNDKSIEVRKYLQAPILGLADLQSGIDGKYMGSHDYAAACNGGDNYRELGVSSHLVFPCFPQPFCFGQWKAQNTNHWLWQGSGLNVDDLFGNGRLVPGVTIPTYAVGHEVDTWTNGMSIPGLAPGQEPLILASGTNHNQPGTTTPARVNDLLNTITQTLTCTDVQNLVGATEHPGGGNTTATDAGTILYFPHAGGGHVLVIGASATPWALASDTSLAGLMYRAIQCFAFGQGCGFDSYLPLILKE